MENEKEIEKEQASFDPSPNAEFVREKIKQKPINRKKLLRRTLFTMMAAVIFGVVACVTFFLLEPFISERLSSDKPGTETVKPNAISLTETPDDTSDEMLPEDMYATDTEMISEALQGNVSEVNQNIKNIEDMISAMEFGLDDYQKLYSDLRELAEKVSGSLVTVIGVTEETDLLNNPYEDSAQISGVVVADNGRDLLILVKDAGLSDADDIIVTFANGANSHCEIVGRDEATGLVVLGVNKGGLSDYTLSLAVPASLGSSRSTSLKGNPVLALGSPVGISDSFAYGMVTSGAQQLYLTDADYSLITTDMPGTASSSGVLVSLKGNIIGIIDNSFESGTASGTLNAIGITELKPLIEKLSNAEQKAYFGIQAMDITYPMRNAYGLPEGIYIRFIEIDSPAMNAGLQNGDILVGIDGADINNYHDYVLWLFDTEPGTTVNVSILRQSVDNYVPMECSVELGTVAYTTGTSEE